MFRSTVAMPMVASSYGSNKRPLIKASSTVTHSGAEDINTLYKILNFVRRNRRTMSANVDFVDVSTSTHPSSDHPCGCVLLALGLFLLFSFGIICIGLYLEIPFHVTVGPFSLQSRCDRQFLVSSVSGPPNTQLKGKQLLKFNFESNATISDVELFQYIVSVYSPLNSNHTGDLRTMFILIVCSIVILLTTFGCLVMRQYLDELPYSGTIYIDEGESDLSSWYEMYFESQVELPLSKPLLLGGQAKLCVEGSPKQVDPTKMEDTIPTLDEGTSQHLDTELLEYKHSDRQGPDCPDYPDCPDCPGCSDCPASQDTETKANENESEDSGMVAPQSSDQDILGSPSVAKKAVTYREKRSRLVKPTTATNARKFPQTQKTTTDSRKWDDIPCQPSPSQSDPYSYHKTPPPADQKKRKKSKRHPPSTDDDLVSLCRGGGVSRERADKRNQTPPRIDSGYHGSAQLSRVAEEETTRLTEGELVLIKKDTRKSKWPPPSALQDPHIVFASDSAASIGDEMVLCLTNSPKLVVRPEQTLMSTDSSTSFESGLPVPTSNGDPSGSERKDPPIEEKLKDAPLYQELALCYEGVQKYPSPGPQKSESSFLEESVSAKEAPRCPSEISDVKPFFWEAGYNY